MKKFLIGLVLTASIGAQAECYWGYANHNLDKKMEVGIGSLGLSSMVTFGTEKALELITESIVVAKEEKSEAYLKIIKDSNFGRNLEKIIENKKTDRLESMRNKLSSKGIDVSVEQIANEVLRLNSSNQLCEKEYITNTSGRWLKGVNYKNLRDVRKLLESNLKH